MARTATVAGEYQEAMVQALNLALKEQDAEALGEGEGQASRTGVAHRFPFLLDMVYTCFYLVGPGFITKRGKHAMRETLG
jgi:hypothetical protein